MTNTNKLTKENMMNELNEYGYNENDLYNIINWFYELDEKINTIEKAYDILKGNKVNYKQYKHMVIEYYIDYE
jgi:uncharacterized protein Smg (DUF494 family)